MNEKDLMKGLSNIDEDLIAEASRKRKRRGVTIPSSVAAGICLVIGAGTIWGGTTIVRQRQELSEMKADEAAQAAMDSIDTVGSGSEAMGRFSTVSSYRELFKVLDARWSQSSMYGDVTYAEAAADGAEEEVAAEEAPAAAEVSASASKGDSGDYSKTNLMTEGVDESDITKTDGKFIYMVQSGSVKIVDIRDGEAGEDVRVTPPFEAPSDSIRELYVDGDRLVIIVDHAEKKEYTGSTSWVHSSAYVDQTFAYVYDITDPMKAKLLGSMKQDGAYRTSRKVGDTLYLFTDKWIDLENVTEKNANDSEKLSYWIPTVNDIPVSCDCIYLPEEGLNSLVISSFNIDAPDTCLDAKVVINNYSQIYVGNEHVYLYEADWTGNRQLTTISSFSYKDGAIQMEADNSVGGYVADSFAIHESKGALSVLTTDYSGSSEVNTLYLLDEELQMTGRIDEIARGESIYAARYVGDMVYFITYKNMDPMFVADLSDPSDPQLLGNVEISGFSDYLHQWDDTHILGIGYETTDQSDRYGMKLVMFDVEDPLHPTIENTLVLEAGLEDYGKENRWFYSDAVSSNYKAILADPGKNLIGFGYNASAWTSEKDENFQNYELLSYDSKDGFHSLLTEDVSEWGVYDIRGLYSGDWFYLACYGQVRSFNLD